MATQNRSATVLPGSAAADLPAAPVARVESSWWRSWETAIAASAAIAITAHLVLRFLPNISEIWIQAPLYATLVLGGIPLVFGLLRRAWAGEFGSDLLAGVSIVTAVLLDEYLAGAVVVLMLSGGTALEQYATRRASSVLAALARRMPRVAHLRTARGLQEIPVDDVAVGDTLVLLPHEACPVDGVVVEGYGSMDESFLTGEPYQIDKAPGAQVLSGALNGDSALTIRAAKRATDSRYAEIVKVVAMAEQGRPRMRRLADRLGAWYTPAAVSLALLSWALSGDPVRFLSVLVIATPCPLLIAVPVAIIGAISLAARHGIVIKNAAMLEQVDQCGALFFDKTGTLTLGRPVLTEVIVPPGQDRSAVLQLAASLEHYSKHPLAAAVVETARRESIPLLPVTFLSETPGQGLKGIIAHDEIVITGRSKLAEMSELPPVQTGLECVVVRNGAFAALLRFRDEPRPEGRPFLQHLGPLHAVQRLVLLTGDRDTEARYLADRLGIIEVFSGKSPEEKAEIVQAATLGAKTLYVGDGINDAPAMLAATVGVALGAGAEVTTEAADAVVLEASLGKVDMLMHIGCRMRRIALQSAWGGMALSMAGMLVASVGYLPPVWGAVAQEFIDLLAVLNALRVSFAHHPLTDYQKL